MTPLQAKEILSLYRPGTADAEDPAFVEALRLCEYDPELQAWFDEHCLLYQAIRSKLKEISIPEGLKEQILAERPVAAAPSRPSPVRRTVVALVALAIIVAVFVFQMTHPEEDTGFAGYRDRMIGTALRSYSMDLETESLDRVQSFFNTRNAIADFRLPEGLRKARLAGCVVTRWQDRPVSMVCFHSGKPLHPGESSDLWLFVAPATSIHDAPRDATRVFEQINAISAVSWTENGKTYLLAIEGDRKSLEEFL
jgi:hypothetical protein